MTHEYTSGECRRLFIEHLWVMIGYWNTVEPIEGEEPITQRHRLSGLVHSILATIDGVSMSMPAFMLIPAPHPDDKEDHQQRGQAWWPTQGDLGGFLHEILYNHEPEKKQ